MAGVTEKAIRKGIASGRLRKCVGKNDRGQPFIKDVAIGLQEWQDNAGRVPPGTSAAVAPEIAPDGDTPTEFGLVSASTLNEAQVHATLERARKLRLQNDVTRGRLVEVAAVVKEAFESARIIRENVLNIPARIAAELAAESDPIKVHIHLDLALREALSGLADQLQAVAHE